MNSEGLIGINVPNAFTILVYLVIWSAIFYMVAQLIRRGQSDNTGA